MHRLIQLISYDVMEMGEAELRIDPFAVMIDIFLAW